MYMYEYSFMIFHIFNIFEPMTLGIYKYAFYILTLYGFCGIIFYLLVSIPNFISSKLFKNFFLQLYFKETEIHVQITKNILT